MIDKIQSLKGKTKLKFYENVGNYFEEMNDRTFQFQQDTFAKCPKY